jgi:hypothetical protein
LTGRRQFQVFIDTWVGPGHDQGNGWLVHASLEYKAGTPQRPVAAVMPIFNPTSVVYGDPARSAGRTRHLAIPPSISGGRIWVLLTGHGQGNTENCAEFCRKLHTIDLDGQRVERIIWRDDCTATRTHGPQQGTWRFPRAGWCPGDMVRPWTIDVPRGALLGEGNFTWRPEPWENHQRFGYDGGSHTEPHYELSALLILYR